MGHETKKIIKEKAITREGSELVLNVILEYEPSRDTEPLQIHLPHGWYDLDDLQTFIKEMKELRTAIKREKLI